MGEGLGAFLAHPAFQGLAAYLETPGPDGHGPVKADLRVCGACTRARSRPRTRPAGRAGSRRGPRAGAIERR